MTEKLSNRGYGLAAILWVAILALASGEAACLADGHCGRGDLMLSGMVSAAMLVPAYIGALLLGTMFPRLGLTRDDE